VRDPGAAEDALLVAVDAGHPEWSPAAEVVRGVICVSRQDLEGAMRAYGAAIASEHPTHAARAWFNLGTFHQQRGELALALAAMRQLVTESTRGQRFDIVEDVKDISVGRGKGTQKWRRWVRRDPS
jgi:hypothetical protein